MVALTASRAKSNGKNNGKESPFPIYRLLPAADNILDIDSWKENKSERAGIFFTEFKALVDDKKREYDEAKAGRKFGSEAVQEAKNAYDYVAALFANVNNLASSFQSMQTRWHYKVDEIANFYKSRLDAGGFYGNLKKYLPLAGGVGLGATAFYSGGWSEIVKFAVDLVPAPFAKVAEMGTHILGFIGLGGVANVLNRLTERWNRKTREKRDKELDVYLREESLVRTSIRDTVQQIALALSALFNYRKELETSGDSELLNLSSQGNGREIWTTVNRRILDIQQRLPEDIRDLFATALQLPDYIASRIQEGTAKKAAGQEEKAAAANSVQ